MPTLAWWACVGCLGGLIEGEAVFYRFQPTLTAQVASHPARVRIYFPRPQDGVGQTVSRWIDVPRPHRRKNLHDFGRLNILVAAQFDLEPGKLVQTGYSAIVAIRPIELDREAIVESTRSAAERSKFRRFLLPTASTGADGKDIADFALAAAGNGTTLERARRLYDAVLDRTRYQRENAFKGASRCFDDGIGECGDYVALFVACCRHADIPARSVCGFAFERGRWDLHVWAEFHVPGVGWVPCDLSHGDNGPAIADQHFARLDATRLAVTRDNDLEFKETKLPAQPIVQEYLFEFEGDERPSFEWNIEGSRLASDDPDVLKISNRVPAGVGH